MKNGRIQEAQKHPDPDPQHCEEETLGFYLPFPIHFCKYSIKYEKCCVGGEERPGAAQRED
jgi:hypothetical protein